MKALFELFRRFDARCIFGSIRRLGGMSRPKVKCYDLRSTHALRVEGDVNLANVNLCHVISIHTLRVEGDGTVHRRVETEFYFYPRPPGGGRQLEDCRKHLVDYFYPRPPGGGRLHTHCSRKYRVRHFYPRPPGGGRLKLVEYNVIDVTISIHALRVEGDKVSNTIGSDPSISIHALRVEGDATEAANKAEQAISIHALRVEGDNHRLADLEDIERFLSTPSGWRATRKIRCLSFGMIYFYPRPPGGGRQVDALTDEFASAISIHALRVEGDCAAEDVDFAYGGFLSTPSGWRATAPQNV